MEKEKVKDTEKEENEKESASAEKEKKSGSNMEREAATAVSASALEKLILDTSFNKYDIILLARRWAYELKNKEGESRTLQDLIAVAISDILSSRVSHKMVSDLPVLPKGGGGKKSKAPANILEAIPSKGGKKNSSKDDEDEE